MMRTRRRRQRLIARGLVALMVTALTAATSATATSAAASRPTRPTNLEELMQTMASTPGVVAEFVETKRIDLLDDPLVTRGVLYFIPPRRLARHTEAPGRSTLIIDGDRLLFADEAGNEKFDLSTNPIARVFVENFIVLFNGDLAELRARYRAEFAIDGNSWQLQLMPRQAPLNQAIESITMRGDDGGMRSMTMLESSGDVTETFFSRVDANHEFGAAEIARYFQTTRKSAAAPPLAR